MLLLSIVLPTRDGRGIVLPTRDGRGNPDPRLTGRHVIHMQHGKDHFFIWPTRAAVLFR